MQKAIFFLLTVLALLIIAYFSPTLKQKEGFQNLMGIEWTTKNDGTPKALYTDLPVKQPGVVGLAEAGVGNIQPSPPPASDLPTAPISQRAKETPNPYRNPTTEPAKYIQLLAVKEDLQAFFGFQAPLLDETNDPAIQIPLTRARADMGELLDIQSVIERNPGLPSRITNKQLDDIRSNLRYLQSVLRDLEASGAIKPEALEAFEDSGSSSTDSNTSDARATLKELQDFQIKIVVEIRRLGASGTSDPVLQARLNTLDRIKNEVDDIITKLQNGSLTPDIVPIYVNDIKKALPVLGNPTDPLPTLLKKNNLPPAVASLFPGGLSAKDTEQAVQINNIVKGYMNNLFEGASWGVNLMFQYDNPKVLKLKADAANSASPPLITDGLPGVSNSSPSNPSPLNPSPSNPHQPIASSVNTNDTTDPSYSLGLPGLSSRFQIAPLESGHLDWKKRTQEIKEQVRRRGLQPSDFGALPDNVEVSNEFSWRGHAHMMCSRLNSTMDPGLGVSVGCPATNWPGWKD
jgi:hypothetical protein